MRSNRRRLNSNVDSVFEIPRRSILNQMNHWTGGQIADEINDYLSETNPTIRVTNAFFTGNTLGIEYTAPNTNEAEDAFYYVLSDKYTPLNSSRKLNSSADVDRYLNITSMDSDNTKYAYSLEIISENSRSIYAESDVYGWTYKVDKKTTAVWLDGKKIADRCTYSIDEYFDAERPVNSSKRSKKLNSSVDTNDAISALREYKETVEDTIPGIKEELDWLSIEIQDYVDGELDDSYEEHIKACIDKLQEVMKELHNLHTDVHVFINELD